MSRGSRNAATALVLVVLLFALATHVAARSVVRSNTLPVPSHGARPEFLADGSPVWVVRHEDRSVSVLGGVSRRPWGIGVLSEWCESSRWFEDVHGVLFDEYGFLKGGPASQGMLVYRFRMVGRDRVAVTGNVGRRLERGHRTPQRGPHCGGQIDSGQTSWHDDGLLRTASSTGPRTHDFVMLWGDLVIEPTGASFCVPSATNCTWRLAAPGIDRGLLRFEHATRLVFHGPYAGRVSDGRVTELFSPSWQR